VRVSSRSATSCAEGSHGLLSEDWTAFALARKPEPSAHVPNEPGCYHFRVLDPRIPLRTLFQSKRGTSATTRPGDEMSLIVASSTKFRKREPGTARSD
jgi:hypothetical protein